MNLSILNLASALAAHASARQGVIAENVAHADTPGYRARDVRDFSEILDGIAPFAAKMTRPGHIPFGDAMDLEPQETSGFGTETPNGNSVALEDQMMRGAEVRQEHELALGVYAKSMEILRTAVTK